MPCDPTSRNESLGQGIRSSPDIQVDPREYPVLYVDAEPEGLRVFELGFRREFAVLTAGSAEEALATLNRTPVALVACAQHLPGTSGIELLARARDVDSRTVRVLVTASADAAALAEAMNGGVVSRFVSKPWTPEAMRDTLRRGIEIHALERERGQLLRELTLLHRVAVPLAQELRLAPLLDRVLAVLTGELGYDAAALLVLDLHAERLLWNRFAPDDEAVSLALREIDVSWRGAASFMKRLCSGETQLLALDRALQLESALRRWVTEVSAEEILVVPLLGRDQVLGALAIDNRRGGRRFGEDDQTLLEGFAAHAGIAIENAQLVDGLRAQVVRLQGAAPEASASLDPPSRDC